MNQSNKKGFAALYDLQERKRQAKNDSPPLPTTPQDQPPPVTTTPHQSPPLPTTLQEPPLVREESRPSHAPARDFNRRANSLEREALPQGLFPGASKKIYDALYLRTRGANPPRQRVRASRRDFLDWTDIRNLKTVDNNIRLLMSVGLIIRHWELGSNEGSEYEVRLPEELPPLPTTPHHSPVPTTPQFLGSGYTQFLGSGGYSQLVDLKATSPDDKTNTKTNTNTDDDEALTRFVSVVAKATRELTGKGLSPVEAEKWEELAEVLVTELKMAAGRTNVSSVPAFLAEHLRRRLWKRRSKAGGEGQADAAPSDAPPRAPSPEPEASACPDCFGTGMYYPEGFDKGVARCRHPKLRPNEGHGEAAAGDKAEEQNSAQGQSGEAKT